MCAIAGQASFSIAVRSKTTKLMLSKMRHRGPDDQGIFIHKHITLGMNRLSIIDLKEGGQPFIAKEHKLVIVGNGEIYNYQDLKKNLTSPYTYQSRSDIEVALHAYAHFGLRFAKKLRGMFALAIFDEKKHQLILVRDRLGEKPLYYTKVGKQFYFASELKAVASIPGLNKALDNTQIDAYLHFQYLPEAKTPFKNIAKLPAGHLMVVDLLSGKITIKSYWSPSNIKPKLYDSPVSTLRKAIERSISATSIADVEVGASLSGGLDSATIYELSTKKTGATPKAVTIGYQEKSRFDESQIAKTIVKQADTHYIEKISTDTVVKNFPKVVYYSDEPIADIASSAIYQVGKIARSKKLKVLLTGLGGDELFWGYSWVRSQTKKNVNNDSSEYQLFEHTKTFKIAENVLKHFTTRQFKSTVPSNYSKTICYFNKKGLSELEIAKQALDQLRDMWLIPNCVELNDRLFMANSVEARAPFLDHELFHFAYSSVRNMMGYKLPHKFWLKQAVADLFDGTFLDRPKQGFTPPVKDWLRGIVGAYSHLLADGFLSKHGIFNSYFLKIASRLSSMCIPFWPTLYQLIVLEMWGRMYVDDQSFFDMKPKGN